MRYARKNIVAAKRLGGAFAEKLYDGTTTTAVFNDWFENTLIPELKDGDVIIMDNARFHSKTELAKIAARNGTTVIFLPPYSPDLNPIEKLWANIKRYIRNNIHKFSTLEDCILSYF